MARTRRESVTQTPRLSDLTLADAGRSFIMRPGSVRALVLPAELAGPEVSGPVRVTPEESAQGWSGELRRYRVEAMNRGSAVICAGDARWQIEVRGARLVPEQTRDDTDAGWAEHGSGHSRTWWEEQRPPHW